MSDFKLNSVNWQDGMLLSMSHLRDQDSYFEELSRWYAAAVNDNYGLVKKSPESPSLKMNSTLSGNRLKVEIGSCSAILPGGALIEFNERSGGGTVLKAEADINETQIPVFLGAVPGEKGPVGDPDPSEEVPRVPYLAQSYLLTLGNPPNLPESSYLQVASLTVSGSEVAPSRGYIPPCVHIGAHDHLAALAVDYRNRIDNLLQLATRAYTAVLAGIEGTSTKRQSAVIEMMSYLVYHVASHLDDFSTGRNAPHPRHMIIQFKKLFRVVSSLLNLHPGIKDYINEKFFKAQKKTDIRTFLSSLDAFLLAEYDHRDIAGQMEMIEKIFGPWRELMAFLAQFKDGGGIEEPTESLTYHGETYQNAALRGHQLEQVGEMSYLVMDPEEVGPLADTVILINKDLFSDAEWLNMQIRLGLNEARGLGETDPVDIDIKTFRSKVALHPLEMLPSRSGEQVTLIFRGMPDTQRMQNLTKSDLNLYVLREKV